MPARTYCTNCRTVLQPEARFCANCGARVAESTRLSAEEDLVSSCRLIFEAMPSHFNKNAATGLNAVYQFDLTGEGGGTWQLIIDDGNCRVQEGQRLSPNITISMSAQDYVDMTVGELDGEEAFKSGRVRMTGDMGLALRLQDLFVDELPSEEPHLRALGIQDSGASTKGELSDQKAATSKGKTQTSQRAQATLLTPENSVPFQNMLTSLLHRNDSQGFRYWRDRLYGSHRSDGYEYLARMIDASVAAGVLFHLWWLESEVRECQESVSDIEVGGLPRLQMICETIETCLSDALAAIEGFVAYDFEISLRPSFDEALTDWALDDQRSARLDELRRACEADLAESPVTIQRLADWYSPRRIGEAGAEEAILTIGIATSDRNLAEDVHLRCAKQLLFQLAQLRSRDDTAMAAKAESLAATCASRVSPDDIDYASLADLSAKTTVELPSFIPLTMLDGAISFTDEGIVTVSEDSAAHMSAVISSDSLGEAANLERAATAPKVRDGSDAEGAAPPTIASPDELAASLSNLVGLSSIKQSLAEVGSLLTIAQDRRSVGLPSTPLSLHAVFAGNPGTGKTTVARFYARMLQSLGYLKRGHLVEVDRSQLVAEYLGQTASKTLGVLQSSLGGVLFIDEAYALKQDQQDIYGQECIDTLLKFMEDHRDELVIILAGYRDRMAELLDTNPGFGSRFSEYFDFEDYTDDQLARILTKMAQERGYELSSDALAAAIESISRQRAGKYFGNARSVRNLLEQGIRRQAARLDLLRQAGEQLTRDRLMRLERSDLVGTDVPRTTGQEDLDKLIGLASVKRTVQEYEALIRAAKARGQDPRALLQPYFVMTGSPGTGKTTVARVMGRIFKELEYLPSDHVIEASREDLVAGYIGQTAIKTREILEKSLGGTLFIDEAYSLAVRRGGGEDFGREAIETLLKFMEDNRGRLVVVAAGYEREMREFLNFNPGLRSRFTNVINFPDYTSEECAEIFVNMMRTQRFKIAEDAQSQLPRLFEGLKTAPNWSNGRDVRTLVEFVARAQARRIGTAKESDPYLVTLGDLEFALNDLLKNKAAGA